MGNDWWNADAVKTLSRNAGGRARWNDGLHYSCSIETCAVGLSGEQPVFVYRRLGQKDRAIRRHRDSHFSSLQPRNVIFPNPGTKGNDTPKSKRTKLIDLAAENREACGPELAGHVVGRATLQ